MSVRSHVKDAIDMIPSPTGDVTSDADVLQPDTFWELIEKLLLHSSVDEQRRQRHNAALSALCRGYALPRLPRQQKRTSQSSNVKKSVSNQSESINTISLKTKTLSSTNAADEKKKRKSKNVRKKSVAKPSKVEPKASKDEDAIAAAKGTKSECSVNDLVDVVFVKDVDVPVSERLWRFAIKNRKQKNEGEEKNGTESDGEVVTKLVPSARSNAAIYEGLRQRLDEAKNSHTDSEQDKLKTNRKSSKKNKSRKFHKGHKPWQVSTSKPHIKKSTTPTKEGETKSKLVIPTTKSESSVTKHSCQSSQSQPESTSAHDICREPLNNLIESSENLVEVNEDRVTPENVETKKTQYDKILRKRVNCGSQLESLNKEIVNKKLNPRTTLSRETTRKYAELKTKYLKLCYQESSLRHQITLLQAEIYLMQNRAYHKQPAAIKTITLDSTTTKLPTMPDVAINDQNNTNTDGAMFPRLKTPKPLLFHKQLRSSPEKQISGQGIKHHKNTNEPKQSMSDQTGACGTNLPIISDGVSARGICSMYSLTADIEPPPIRFPSTLVLVTDEQEQIPRITHRLPRMATTSINEIHAQ